MILICLGTWLVVTGFGILIGDRVRSAMVFGVISAAWVGWLGMFLQMVGR
jgi:hypothetical protein